MLFADEFEILKVICRQGRFMYQKPSGVKHQLKRNAKSMSIRKQQLVFEQFKTRCSDEYITIRAQIRLGIK